MTTFNPFTVSTNEQFEFDFTKSSSITSLNSSQLNASNTNSTQHSIANLSYDSTLGPITGSSFFAPATLANHIDNSTLHVHGDAEFYGDIKIKGTNLSERLDVIEQRLAILRPNNDLENRWEKLKSLGDEYRHLEKEILEKEKLWEILKK